MAIGSHRCVLPSLPLGGGRLGRTQADAVRPEAQPAAPRLAGRAQAGGFVRQVWGGLRGAGSQAGPYIRWGGHNKEARFRRAQPALLHAIIKHSCAVGV